MNWLSKVIAWVFETNASTPPAQPSAPEPVVKIDLPAWNPWLFACAVGAKNGSCYGEIGRKGAVDFERWLSVVSRKNWHTSGCPDSVVESALRDFANKNSHRHMNDVMSELEPTVVVIGPGETKTFRVGVSK